MLQQQIASQKRKSDLDIEKLRKELSEMKKKLLETEELEKSLEILSQLSSGSESTTQETELRKDGIETNSVEQAASKEELTPKCESKN